MAQQDLEARIAKLEKKLAEVEDTAERARDYEEIWNMMCRRQNYMHNYNNEMLAQQFPPEEIPGEEIRIEIADLGPITGLENVKNHYRSQGEGVSVGWMAIHMVTTPVIVLSPDRKKARMITYSFGPGTLPGTAYPCEPDKHHTLNECWLLGKYNCECIKLDGKWYFTKFAWHVIFRTPYNQGWVKQSIMHSYTARMGEPYWQPGRSNYYKPYHIDRKNLYLPYPPEDDYYEKGTDFDDLTLYRLDRYPLPPEV